MKFRTIGLIGYGEVGKIFAGGLKDKDGVDSVRAWDRKFVGDTAAAELAHAKVAGISAKMSSKALCIAS